MRRRTFRLLVLVLTLLSLAVIPVAGHAQTATPTAPTAYSETDLGTLGGLNSDSVGINAAGQVVGSSEVVAESGAVATPGAEAGPPPRHAFFWDGINLIDLGTFGGPTSYALNVNDAGQVAGRADTADGHVRAFLWDDWTMTDLGTLGGLDSSAVGINNLGQVVGLSTTAPDQQLGDPGTHAFLWDNGTMTDLGTLGGATSRANTINDAGQVAGASLTGAGELHPFLWQDGDMTDLGALPPYTAGRAATVNAHGEVAGWSETAGASVTSSLSAASQRAFLYRDGQLIDLGALPGLPASTAAGVNDAGWVVGTAFPEDFSGGAAASPAAEPQSPHGFLWIDGTMTDLNDLIPLESGWEVRGAPRINNAGQIAAICANKDGAEHACLLTPTS